MTRTLFRLLLALGLAWAASSAMAQYPVRPVRIIVPFPAGGASDNAARTLAQGLSKTLGQPVVVDNRPGANGAIAAQAVLSAPPDGYTVLWGVASMAALPMMQKSTPFESLNEFTPVSTVGRFTFALFAHPSVLARTVGELVAYAKANPDKLNYASGTAGEFMTTAQFIKTTGAAMTRVPYKGGAQAFPDLLAGRVQVYMTPISLGLPHAKEGRLRVLATLLPQRSAAAPDVPTLAEAGVAGVTTPTWQALFAPPKTPRDIVDRLQREVALVVREADVRAQYDAQTFQIDASTPEALTALINQDVRSWTQFIRDNGITPE